MPLDGNTHRFILEMERFCAYQERSAFEIKTKLHRKGATDEQVALVVALVAVGVANVEARQAAGRLDRELAAEIRRGQ